MFSATTSASIRRSSRGCFMLAHRCCGDGSHRNSCDAAADLAERYGNGELRTTITQNLVIVNVPAEKTKAVAQGLEAAGLHVAASAFWRGAVACSGSEFCKLAITETKAFTHWLVEELEERLPAV